MKIIDEKGRLFSRINIIDLSVLLVLLFSVQAVFFGYKATTAKPSPLNERWISAQVRFEDVDSRLSDLIKAGDCENEQSGRNIGRIAKVVGIKPYDVVSMQANKELIVVEHPFRRMVTMDLNMLCQEKGGALYYKDHLVKIGTNIVFSTAAYYMYGTIIGMDAA